MADPGDRWARLLAGSGPERAAQPLRICELCVDALAVTGAGIAMVTAAGHRGVVCATNDVSATIEDLQLTLGEGPCVDAAVAGSPVLLADSVDRRTWRWNAGRRSWMARQRQESRLCSPFRCGSERSASAFSTFTGINLGKLSKEEMTAALVAADAAAMAVLHLDVDGAEAFTDDHESRAAYQLQVHQATGMVTAQAGVTIDQAFLMLRARAFADSRPLAELAAEVVARRVRFATEDQ